MRDLHALDSLDPYLARAAELTGIQAGGRAPVPADAGWGKVVAKAPSLDAALHPNGKQAERSGRVGPSSAGTGASRWMRATVGAVGVVAVVAGAAALLVRQGKPAMTAAATYRTTVGQRATFTLRDGTRVTLAPESRLVVAPTFGTSERAVTLEGQAYFHVSSRSDAPFVVQAGATTTRVLGTAFDVYAYRDDPSVRVAVVTGKVAVRGPRGSAVTLIAGDVARVRDSAVVTAVGAAGGDVASYVQWTDGRLNFVEAPLPEVLRALGRWYGIHFRMSDSTLARATLTATLDYRARAHLLSDLKTLLDVTMSFEDTGDSTVVTLHAKRAKAARPNARPLPSSSSSEVGR